MNHKTISLVLGVSGLSISTALGITTGPSSLARNVGATSAVTNTPILVAVTFTNGAGVAWRGFYYSEQIPSGLKVTTQGLWLNGQSVTNYAFDSGLDSDVYPGCTPYRWVLEMPVVFTANNPVPPNGTVQIEYSITSPTVGSFGLQQFNWIGYDSANTNAAFGCSGTSDAQSVSFNAGPPPPSILTTGTSVMNFTTGLGTNPASQILGITNSGTAALSWTTVADSGTPAWLAVNPTNGVGDGTVTVSVSSIGLAAGSYSKNLTVTAVGATNSPQTVAVMLTVTVPPPPIISSVAAMPDATMQLLAVGHPSLQYAVQASTNLSKTNWMNIGTTTADTNGVLLYLDLDATNYPMRFYRLAVP